MEKVAIINSVFEYGSTGLLAKQLYEYGWENGYEAFAFYGRGIVYKNDHIIKIDKAFEFYLHKLLTLITGYQGAFSKLATRKLLQFLKTKSIKKVILLNIHGYYINEKKLFDYLKSNNIQTVYVTPDEYAGLGKCCYNNGCEKYKSICDKCPQKKDYPKSLFFDRSRSIFEMKRLSYSNYDKITLIGPESNLEKFRMSALTKNMPMKRASWGIDLDTYKYMVDEGLYIKYGIPKNKVIILTVAHYSNIRKGVKKYFFELARRLQKLDYHFINVGYDGNLSSDEMPKNMTTIGYMDDQEELAKLYSISDLYLLASVSDTMPLSCLISFACETPVCCFYTSGLKFLAERDNPAILYCDDINLDALEKKVRGVQKKDEKTRLACRRLAENEYSKNAFNKKVYDVFEDKI